MPPVGSRDNSSGRTQKRGFSGPEKGTSGSAAGVNTEEQN